MSDDVINIYCILPERIGERLIIHVILPPLTNLHQSFHFKNFISLNFHFENFQFATSANTQKYIPVHSQI